MNILIFRTNISSKEDFNIVKNNIKKYHSVSECSIDLYDKDRVLRLISDDLTVDTVEREVDSLGFFCKEMED